ncbi:MAG TPA: ribonuclease P protein component [Candidatus Paceibacterota bacterium]
MAIKIARLPSDQFRAKDYKTTPTAFFLLKTKRNSGDGARIGVVVGVSVHKTAVKRNFWKRQALGGITPRAAAGNDILMIVLPGANRLTKKQFQEELAKAFARTRSK